MNTEIKKPQIRQTSNHILYTTNHNLFVHDKTNRQTGHNPRLRELMQAHGWLPQFPAIVSRNEHGFLILKDGQHRLAYAKELGLGVYYVISNTEGLDIAAINCSQRAWASVDYVTSYAGKGLPHYVRLLELSESTGIGARACAVLLNGGRFGTGWANKFKAGQWEVTDEEHFFRVWELVRTVKRLVKWGANNGVISSISQIVGYSTVSDETMIARIKANEAILKLQPTTEAFIAMFETVYNKRNQHPIQIVAEVREGIRASKLSAVGMMAKKNVENAAARRAKSNV